VLVAFNCHIYSLFNGCIQFIGGDEMTNFPQGDEITSDEITSDEITSDEITEDKIYQLQNYR
jgi:hypothetical protein